MKAGFAILALLPVLAGAQVLAADLGSGNPEAIVRVAVAAASQERAVRTHLRPRADAPEVLSPLAYGAFALAEEGKDEELPSNRSVRLYPVAHSDSPARAAASAAKESDEISRAKKPSLPEPGSWAMILAGLLGVGAIARRRMSA